MGTVSRPAVRCAACAWWSRAAAAYACAIPPRASSRPIRAPVREGEMIMRNPFPIRAREEGVMLIEALIAILIFSIGILAVVGMQATAIKNVTESKSRSEAAFLAEELMAQMWIDQNISTGAVQVNTSNVTVANYNYGGSGTPPRDWERSRPPRPAGLGASPPSCPEPP